jgi:hypothetical protein
MFLIYLLTLQVKSAGFAQSYFAFLTNIVTIKQTTLLIEYQNNL